MSRRLAYAQLLRIPNVFTALADVAIGLVAGAPLLSVPWLALASASLYCSGMVGNDYFDRHIDGRERPMRPIPSGRIEARFALRLMIALMAIGLLAAAAAGWSPERFRIHPFVIAMALAMLILAYNAFLKSTIVGPLAMGGCRSLNVLLGFTMTPPTTVPSSARLAVAAIVGIYIVGVTVFARDEALRSRTGRLALGMAIVMAALLAAVSAPALSFAAGRSLAIPLIALLAAQLGILMASALRAPTPGNVQAAIKAAILGLIVLDAALATSLAGPVGLLLLVLAVPATYVGRWVYST